MAGSQLGGSGLGPSTTAVTKAAVVSAAPGRLGFATWYSIAQTAITWARSRRSVASRARRRTSRLRTARALGSTASSWVRQRASLPLFALAENSLSLPPKSRSARTSVSAVHEPDGSRAKVFSPVPQGAITAAHIA